MSERKVRHEHADINGIRMHYAVAGEGDTVLLLHGFPEYWGVWRGVLAELSSHHRVVAPDLRGYNLTSRPADVAAYGIEYLVEDVRALVAHLGGGKVRLVGQDWGGLLGWSFLLRHPELVERFVTIDVTHPALFNEALRTDPAQQKASEYMLLFRTPGAGEEFISKHDFAFGRRAVFEDALAHGATLSEADIEEWLSTWKQPGAITAGLNWYRAAEIGPPDGKGSPGGSNVLEGLDPARYYVDVPVLVLWGEEDAYLLPSGLDRLHRYVRDLRIHKIAGATHWVTLEEAALVNRMLREFFGEKR